MTLKMERFRQQQAINKLRLQGKQQQQQSEQQQA